jgi:DNA-directed RNA polymerase-3 subunit RPC5
LDTLVAYREETSVIPPSAVNKSESQPSSVDVSLSSLKNLDAAHQVQLILFGAKILSFSRIKKLVTSVKSDEELIPLIENVAVMIRGVWVIKSEFNEKINAKPKETLKHPRLSAVRDYLLYLFYKFERVNRSEFVRETKITSDQAFTMLNEIGTVVRDMDSPSGVWELKVPPDYGFVDRKPEVFRRQQDEWEDREIAAVKNYENEFRATDQTVIFTPAGSKSKGKRMSELELDFYQFVKDQLKTFGVVTIESIRNQISTKEVHKKFRVIPDDLLTRVVTELTVPFSDNSFIVKSMGNEKSDNFRIVIIKLLKEKRQVTRVEVMQAIKDELKEQIDNATYLDIMTSLAIAQKDLSWKVRTGLEGVGKE